MDVLTFVAVLLVVGTVNVGLAMNFVNRRADRTSRRHESLDRSSAAYEDRELKRKTFNVEHARTLLLSHSAGTQVTSDQAALISSGA